MDASTVTIAVSGFDNQKIYRLFDVPVLSLAYYGDAANYNYEANQFGLARGDLSAVKAKSAAPMGAGPYRLVKFENNTAYLEANPSYYKGAPATKYVQVQNVAEDIRAASVVQGKIDLADSSLTSSTLTQAGAGETWEAVLSGVPYYTYIGINASTVKVGEDLDSEASVALRNAFAVLFAANRTEICGTYLGEAAKILQYPALNGSWTALSEGQEGWQEAYSVKPDGTPVFTADMNPEARSAAAVEAAKEYLKLAGFTYDETAGTFTAAPEGAKLSYRVLIDNLVTESQRPGDLAARQGIYRQCYGEVLRLGLEVPYYQRQSATFFNITKVAAGSYAGAYTTAYDWMDEVHLISLKPQA